MLKVYKVPASSIVIMSVSVLQILPVTMVSVEMLPDWHQPLQRATFCLLSLTLLQISASVTHFVESFYVILGVAT